MLRRHSAAAELLAAPWRLKESSPIPILPMQMHQMSISIEQIESSAENKPLPHSPPSGTTIEAGKIDSFCPEAKETTNSSPVTLNANHR